MADSVEARRTRALICALREVGELDAAKRLEAALTAGATPQRERIEQDAARALASAF